MATSILIISWPLATPTPPNGYRVKYWDLNNPTNITTVNPNPTTSPLTLTLPQVSKGYGGTVEASCNGGVYSTPFSFTAPYEVTANVTAVTKIGNTSPWLVTSSQNFKVVWGDGTDNTYTAGTNVSVTHTYSTAYTGSIKIQPVDPNSITKLDLTGGATPVLVNTVELKTAELSKFGNLEILNTNEDILVSGAASDLPSTLKTISIPTTTLSGNVLELPESLVNLTLSGNNTLTGNVTGLPKGLITLSLIGNNSVSGNIANLPPSLTTITIMGNNNISGNIQDLSTTVVSCVIMGSNSIAGTVSLMTSHSTLTNLVIEGNNTISGNLSGFSPTNIISLGITGSNTITGSLSSLPYGSTQSVIISGNNTISGSINSLPAKLLVLNIGGSNTVSGDLTAGLPTNLTTLVIDGTGAGVITGNITGLPSTVSRFGVFAGNTVSGTLSTMPAAMLNFQVTGANTLTGDIGLIPANVNTFVLQGSNTATYTTAKTWAGTMYYVNISKTGGYITAQLDKLFNELYAGGATNWGAPKLITVKGTVSGTSAADRAGLTAKGVTITIVP